MSGPLLSRFDLVFVLLDTPDVQRDQLLSAHIMNVHSARNESVPIRRGSRTDSFLIFLLRLLIDRLNAHTFSSFVF